ncbi:MAG: ATP-binding protein [Candidatus Omnitrophota bacterium]
MINPAFEIPSDPIYITEASSRIINSLKDFNLKEDVIFDIRLSVEEAVINAIKYGNNFKKDLPILINYSITGDRLEIIVKDMGKGFDYSSLPDPTSQENILKSGGRGLFLIRNLMDEIKFNDKGNEIKMVKFLTGGKLYGSKRQKG